MLADCILRLESGGDQARFARLYRSTHPRLTRLAAQILGPGPRAEDAVHDAFVKLIDRFDQLRDRPEDQLERWLMVVVRTSAVDILRREGRETALDDAAWDPAVPPDQGEFQTLVALIRAMPEEYRQVLELRFLAEWSLAEIARELGLSEGAVKSRVFRGRKLLIDALRREGYPDGRSYI